MVIAIMAIIMVSAIIMRSMELRHKARIPNANAENHRLRQQVSAMQDRINVLERIVTDRGADTAAQIEALREREPMQGGDKVQ